VFFVCILQCQILIHELQRSRLLHHDLVCIVHCPSFVHVYLLKLKSCALGIEICCHYPSVVHIKQDSMCNV